MFSKWQPTKVYMTRGDKDTKTLKTTLRTSVSQRRSDGCQCQVQISDGCQQAISSLSCSSGTSLVLPSLSELGNRKRLVSRAHLSSELWEEFHQTQFWKLCQYPHHRTTQITSYSHSYGLPLAAREYVTHTGRPRILGAN